MGFLFFPAREAIDGAVEMIAGSWPGLAVAGAPALVGRVKIVRETGADGPWGFAEKPGLGEADFARA